ncbi:MAG: 1-deoxy-D-xylulose-5-phosphate synthase [Treponema sp.]
MKNMTLLEKIENPNDLKQLNKRELDVLSNEIRQEILHVVATNGGHLSSNLGVVELTISLHRVFSTPTDTIIWDVGHQAYAHKLITGRYKDFHTLRQKGGISGFPKREESLHDGFNTGHASTSISAAIGISQSLFLQNIEGAVVAVIGDGALTGGMAFEAISSAGELKRPLIVILNDNQMSISKNTGAMSQYLSRFTMHSGYQNFRYYFDSFVNAIPFIGKKISSVIYAIKKGIKSVFYKHNIFVELGFEYVGPLDGHNITVLEKVLKNVKKLKRPVVVHVRTIKGKGYPFAEANPQDFHGTPPFNLEDGMVERKSEITFTQSFSDSLIENAKKHENIVAITAAMASGTGLLAFKHLFPKRFFDVGIAEQHAVTFAAGLATRGIIPIVAIYSTFLQRSVDQIIHDVALQGLHVIFAVDRAGAVPHDGETHQGVFDISLFRCVPNISILSPSSDVEMKLMMDWALNEKKAVIIRYPKKSCPKEIHSFSYPMITGRGVFVTANEKNTTLLVCLGSIYGEVKEASDRLKEKCVDVDIYNLRFIKPFDEDYFIQAIQKYSHIFIFEDGAKIGGIGEYIEALILKVDMLEKRKRSVHVLGFPDTFLSQGTREEVLEEAGLSSSLIADFVLWNI